MPKLLGELLAAGQFDKSLDIIVGYNSNEGFPFANPFAQDNNAFMSYIKTIEPAISESQLDYITTTLYPAVSDGSYPYKS